ncbi:LON peptidase substrate-binding domain-containing protein [Paraglaciecola aestuariivivens]
MPSCFDTPLFPLSAHIMPGGRLSLRIFEPRYIRMVKQACVSDSGFGICMLDVQGDKASNQHIPAIGTLVKIIDFDLLKDGLLGITVEGQSCFKIKHIQEQKDGLRIGQCQKLANWQWHSNKPLHPLDARLKEIFAKYTELQTLYCSPKFEDPLWVIYRWLELLPLEVQQKQKLLQQKDCIQALDFLTQLVE